MSGDIVISEPSAESSATQVSQPTSSRIEIKSQERLDAQLKAGILFGLRRNAENPNNANTSDFFKLNPEDVDGETQYINEQMSRMSAMKAAEKNKTEYVGERPDQDFINAYEANYKEYLAALRELRKHQSKALKSKVEQIGEKLTAKKLLEVVHQQDVESAEEFIREIPILIEKAKAAQEKVEPVEAAAVQRDELDVESHTEESLLAIAKDNPASLLRPGTLRQIASEIGSETVRRVIREAGIHHPVDVASSIEIVYEHTQDEDVLGDIVHRAIIEEPTLALQIIDKTVVRRIFRNSPEEYSNMIIFASDNCATGEMTAQRIKKLALFVGGRAELFVDVLQYRNIPLPDLSLN